MKYMGSKNRISKHILPIMLRDRTDGQYWVEPFVGGANMIDKVTGNRIGADFNEHVIEALKFIRDCSTPKSNLEFTEKHYNTAAEYYRAALKITPVECYALIAFSFGAKWCGGWSRGKNSKGGQRDYVNEQHKASEKQKPLLQGVEFTRCSYGDLNIPTNSIIYCDPPYEGATGYKDKFNHDDFWQWCRDKAKEGHTVFISEYNAPDDFECIWQQELNVSVAKNGKHKKAVEKLFKLKAAN